MAHEDEVHYVSTLPEPGSPDEPVKAITACDKWSQDLACSQDLTKVTCLECLNSEKWNEDMVAFRRKIRDAADDYSQKRKCVRCGRELLPNRPEARYCGECGCDSPT